ncbi:hypothetical protein N7509_013116 [Penicillium cosmopolitanum]|uniref:FAD dependent oxidoreductase domain-containing protein n=1 Tax=Penicillium cosmopolitanum TaxID=1131564 RepID=A0A9W9SDX8_9EURO|nr:uncharacterized protein N7509_013116 [Penicillium cosmopolitanum]KAJ5376230.1 hypothetical protein N7509_013116 [Penicillium cosmopolitanum]
MLAPLVAKLSKQLSLFLKSAPEPQTDPADHGNPVHLDVIVVGAGLAGLATAIALARRNHKVTIYEQAQRLAEV